MPDFIHETSEPAASNATPGDSTNGRAPDGPSGAKRAAAAPASKPGRPDREDGGAENRAEKRGSKRKVAPAIFTHYYGAFFLLIVALFLGAGYLLLVPEYLSMNNISAETSADADALKKERAYLEALNHSISAAEAIPKDVLDRVDESIPYDVSGIPKLLVTMSAIAKQSNVDLGSIQFSPGSPTEVSGNSAISLSIVPTRISTSLHAKGYQEMRRYLTNLEQSLRLIDVDSISVSGGGGTGEPGKEEGDFSYALQMTAYSVAEAVRKAPTSVPVNQAAVPVVAPGDADQP
jgi:hypothetical protein